MDFTFDFGLNAKSLFDMLTHAFGILFMHELNLLCTKFYIIQVEKKEKEIPNTPDTVYSVTFGNNTAHDFLRSEFKKN